jgi:hypothetical protein
VAAVCRHRSLRAGCSGSVMKRLASTTWVVAGTADARSRLSPLISAHRNCRPVREVDLSTFCDSDLDDAAGALIVGYPRKSVRSALPGVFLRAQNGRRVAAGWLPDIAERLETFARAAAEVQLRRTPEANCGPFILLGESEPRTLDLAARLTDSLINTAPIFQWTAERIRPPDVIAALQGGAGAAFYVGRGTSAGWVAYGGFDSGDASLACGRPIGAVLSLTCSVACRSGTALSFCEEMVLSGLCAVALGAAGLTLHRRNVRLALGLAQALRCTSTLAEALLEPGIPLVSLSRYRILGDPLAPLIGDLYSLERAQRVFAPAPDEVLPVIPLSSWA